MSGRSQPPQRTGSSERAHADGNGNAGASPAARLDVAGSNGDNGVRNGSSDDIALTLTQRSLSDTALDSHCAFLFDHDAYQRELAPVLCDALTSDDPTALMSWLLDNQLRLKNPFTADFIEDGWVENLEHYDVSEFGAYALSAYFEPNALRGLGSGFDVARDALIATGRMPDEAERLLAGEPISVASARNGDNGNGNGHRHCYHVPDGRRAGLLAPAVIKEAVSALQLARRSAVGRHQTEMGAQLDDLVALLEEAESVGVGVMFVCLSVDGDHDDTPVMPAGEVSAVATDAPAE